MRVAHDPQGTHPCAIPPLLATWSLVSLRGHGITAGKPQPRPHAPCRLFFFRAVTHPAWLGCFKEALPPRGDLRRRQRMLFAPPRRAPGSPGGRLGDGGGSSSKRSARPPWRKTAACLPPWVYRAAWGAASGCGFRNTGGTFTRARFVARAGQPSDRPTSGYVDGPQLGNTTTDPCTYGPKRSLKVHLRNPFYIITRTLFH